MKTILIAFALMLLIVPASFADIQTQSVTFNGQTYTCTTMTTGMFQTTNCV